MSSKTENFSMSKASFIEFGEKLKCQSCQKLAYNPHILGKCDHTFCLKCTETLAGKECPVCGVSTLAESCKPDRLIENMIEAYLPVAKFFRLPLDEPSSTGPTSSAKTAEPLIPSTASTSFASSKVSKNLKKDSTKAEPSPSSGRRQRKNSMDNLNASIGSSITPMNAARLQKRNAKGETPLQVACVKKDVGRVKELLEMGADPNTQDNSRWTPLHDAIFIGNESIVELLLDGGANPNIPGGEANETPLHEAVAALKVNIARLLVSRGADLNARNSRGLTPLELCPPNNEELKAVLAQSADVALPPPTPRIADRVRQQALHLFLLDISDKSIVNMVTKLGKTLGFKLVPSYSSRVTHVVVRPEDFEAGKYRPVLFSAVLQGQWIVDFKWLEESEVTSNLVDPAPHELDARMKKIYPDGAAGRLNAAKQLPGLFNNCSIFLHGTFSPSGPSKQDVTAWIKSGSGQVLSRSPDPESIPENQQVPYHARPDSPLAKCGHFIIYDVQSKKQPGLKYNMAHIKSLTVDWLVSCIENFALVDPF